MSRYAAGLVDPKSLEPVRSGSLLFAPPVRSGSTGTKIFLTGTRETLKKPVDLEEEIVSPIFTTEIG
jgi:hypothetical protein